MEKTYLKVGSYIPETEEREAVICREYYGQGLIFKDEEAFLHDPERVCYVPSYQTAFIREMIFSPFATARWKGQRNVLRR